MTSDVLANEVDEHDVGVIIGEITKRPRPPEPPSELDTLMKLGVSQVTEILLEAYLDQEK